MGYNNTLLRKLNVVSRQDQGGSPDDGNDIEIMKDARYLRQSASLINDALQKGFDVLQLENGDVIMTGTKTVVYQYRWDTEKGKLRKVKSMTEGGNPRASRQNVSDETLDA